MPAGGLSREAWWKLSAVDVVEALKAKRVTPLELVQSAKERIAQVDGRLNATPTRCFERAEKRARDLTEKGFPPHPEPGYLYGLPVLIKDTLAVENVRFTMGSKLYEDNIADHSEPVVQGERVCRAGQAPSPSPSHLTH